MAKILLTGGGTAGHCTPNLALVPRLEKDGNEIVYIGTISGIERKLVEEAGIKYYPVHSGKLRRYLSFKNVSDIGRIIKGYFDSKKILKKERPDIVFSKGGFVTVPVVYAASALRIPVVIHESDYTPGLANRLCIKKARKVCVSFESTIREIGEDKCVLTGLPVREELMNGTREKGLEELGFSGEKPVLLIIGGSLGAQAVNDAVDTDIDALTDFFDIAHIRGAEKLNPSLEGHPCYRQFEYVSGELTDFFHAADIVLSRAGANVIFELLALRKPSLLVPLPKESSRGDQVLNAGYFREKGYADVLEQKDITPEVLTAKLKALYNDREKYISAMHTTDHGVSKVIEVIYGVLGK